MRLSIFRFFYYSFILIGLTLAVGGIHSLFRPGEVFASSYREPPPPPPPPDTDNCKEDPDGLLCCYDRCTDANEDCVDDVIDKCEEQYPADGDNPDQYHRCVRDGEDVCSDTMHICDSVCEELYG